MKFGDKDAKQIMTPEPMSLHSHLKSLGRYESAVVASGYSRIPIHKGSMDEVVGVLTKGSDSTPGLGNCGMDFIAKEPYFITKT